MVIISITTTTTTMIIFVLLLLLLLLLTIIIINIILTACSVSPSFLAADSSLPGSAGSTHAARLERGCPKHHSRGG
jgi:uncharacterized integral membrane protein